MRCGRAIETVSTALRGARTRVGVVGEKHCVHAGTARGFVRLGLVRYWRFVQFRRNRRAVVSRDRTPTLFAALLGRNSVGHARGVRIVSPWI